MSDIKDYKQITCVGTGTIGGGWAAYFLSKGFSVVATDPGEQAEQNLNRVIDDAWPVVMQLNPAENASRDNLIFTKNLEEAVTTADFIQESAPDREQLKIDLFSEIGKSAPSDTIIASSSSDFLPSRLASNCNNPQRCIIGHPFAPSYLMPLVEIVGGEKTDGDVLQTAMAFYKSIGKQPLLLKKEINSYIANRFQHVVINEAIALVEQGICDFDDIDNAMRYGPGLRWAFAGPGMCYHLGGGKGGLTAMIEQFGFEGNEGATANLIESVKKLSNDKDIDALENWRDENLISMIKGLKFNP